MSKPVIDTELTVLERKSPSGEAAPHFEPVLDSREAAELLGIHPKTLQRLARTGQIPGVRIGKAWAFRVSHWTIG